MTSRVAKVTYPALPSSCVICNKSANGEFEFVDWGVNVDYYGALTICQYCVINVLELFDYVSKERHDRILEEVARLRKLNTLLTEELEKYHNVVVSLDSVRPDLKLVENDTD